MRRISTLFIIGVASMLVSFSTFSAPKSKQMKPFANHHDRMSYGLGFTFGENSQKNNVLFNKDKFLEGFNHGAQKNKKPLLTDNEMQQAIVSFQYQLMQNQKTRYGNKMIPFPNKEYNLRRGKIQKHYDPYK